MSSPSLHVSRKTPLPSPHLWADIVGMPGGVFTQLSSPACYYNSHTYIGYVDASGSARVASYNHNTHAVAVSPAIITGLLSNWHTAPAVLVRSSDHKIVIAAPSFSTSLQVAISSNAEDVSAWGAASDIGSTLGGSTYVYANLFQLSGESGTIYLVYATQNSTHELCFGTSTDGGVTWSSQTAIYSTGNTTYSLYACSSDMNSRIDFLVSDGAASAGDTSASAYHFYYTGGSYFKSDGTTVGGSAPYSPSNITKIYDGATNGLVRSPCAIVTNGSNPAATWASYNTAGAGSNENYWYGVYTGGSWVVNKIDDTGSLVETIGAAEGGASPDPLTTSNVYVSRKTSGRWQMFLYITANNGSSWTNTQLTFDTSDPSDGGDVKPVYPVNAVSSLRTVWLSGPYGPQSNGSSSIGATCKIRGYPNPQGPF